MNGFERRTEKKRLDILEAVLALYCEQDIEKVSVADIARRAKVSQVTIYKYFESKERLSYCAVEQYYARMYQAFLEVIQSSLPYAEKVRRAFFEPLQAGDAATAAFWDSTLAKQYGSIVAEYEQRVAPHLLDFLQLGVQQGYFRSSHSPETLLFYFGLFGDGAGKQLRLIADRQQRDRLYRELMQLFLYGVAGPGWVQQGAQAPSTSDPQTSKKAEFEGQP